MAGAFDSFGIERNRLIAVIDNAIESVSAAKRRNVSGQLDIFSQGGDTFEGNGLIDIEYPELPPMTEKERLLMEKEICGLYLSGHPLSGYDIPHSVVNIGDIVTSEGDMVSFDDGDNVTVSGIISGAKVRTAKSGGKYAFADIEDMTGRMVLIIFDKVLSNFENVLLTDKAVLVNGDISVKEDEMKLVVKAMKFAPEKGSGADLNADPFPKTEKANTGNYRSKTPDAVQSGGKCDANRDFSAKNSELIVKISSAKKIYLRFPSKGGKIEKRVLALLGIFEGNTEVYVFYNDERKLFRLSGLNCSLPHTASNELIRLMGEENIEFR